MNNWMNNANMASILSEDVNAPELRNPLYSGMRFTSWLKRLTSRK